MHNGIKSEKKCSLEKLQSLLQRLKATFAIIFFERSSQAEEGNCGVKKFFSEMLILAIDVPIMRSLVKILFIIRTLLYSLTTEQFLMHIAPLQHVCLTFLCSVLVSKIAL